MTRHSAPADQGRGCAGAGLHVPKTQQHANRLQRWAARQVLQANLTNLLTCCTTAMPGALQPPLPKLMERSADDEADPRPLPPPPPCEHCCCCCRGCWACCCARRCCCMWWLPAWWRACCHCCCSAAAAAAADMVSMRCCATGEDLEGVVSCRAIHGGVRQVCGTAR